MGSWRSRGGKLRRDERRNKARVEAIQHLREARARRVTLERSKKPAPTSTPGPQADPPGRAPQQQRQAATASAAAPLRDQNRGERDSNINIIPQTGQGDNFNDFAQQLVESVRQLQGGRADQFGAIMAQIMQQSNPVGSSQGAEGGASSGPPRVFNHNYQVDALQLQPKGRQIF